ncbi:hypothetical protein BKA65DRAFT_472326 [Rhexocercosporidium sp. MPI-PUGE-AT-0058]|nr:hypothetical protein BKA65DRAFT_472326 [Rhexocercosporidium sp. MPI-PUGE-AT-0058]
MDVLKKNNETTTSEHSSNLPILLPVEPIYLDLKNESLFKDQYSVQAPGSKIIGLQPHPHVSFPCAKAIVSASVQAERVGARSLELVRPAAGTTVGRGHASVPPVKDNNYDIIMQPKTSAISQEQLVAEAQGIYTGLTMIEAKCIEVDNDLAQVDQASPPYINNQQWQALFALHRTLIHEHHDFLLVSQHPSASPALKRLATKYSMPARLWRHAIHPLLELLRHHLPASLDHMLAFLYLAYSMTTLLLETVPIFQEIWMEFLGDLARYRIAIEDDDFQDKEVWAVVARRWYSKCSRRAVTTGRLYHHLAVLARTNVLQQLFYYVKSLSVTIPFESARKSILTLFSPFLNEDQALSRTLPFESTFIKCHAVISTFTKPGEYEYFLGSFLRLLDPQIRRVTRKFMEQGYHIAIINAAAVLHFLATPNPPAWVIRIDVLDPSTVQQSAKEIDRCKTAIRLSDETAKTVLNRTNDPNVLPYIHVLLVFLHHVAQMDGDNEAILPLYEDMMKGFPWELLATALTDLVRKDPEKHSQHDKMPGRENSNRELTPLPEDFAMCGFSWVDTTIYPDKYFSYKVFRSGIWRHKYDEDDIYREMAGMTPDRIIRILWYGHQLVKLGRLSFKQGRFLKS